MTLERGEQQRRGPGGVRGGHVRAVLQQQHDVSFYRQGDCLMVLAVDVVMSSVMSSVALRDSVGYTLVLLPQTRASSTRESSHLEQHPHHRDHPGAGRHHQRGL